jgi:predicted hydrocarbon binding protein
LVPVSSLSAAEPANPEDWRLRFARERYAKLVEILSQRMSKAELDETLHQLGAYCSSLWEGTFAKYRGDVEGFAKLVKQGASGYDVTWDREKGVITMASAERTDCFCPLISRLQNTPPVVCNCTLGWNQHTWETILERPVRVEVKETVLRGGKRCVFEIHLPQA